MKNCQEAPEDADYLARFISDIITRHLCDPGNYSCLVSRSSQATYPNAFDLYHFVAVLQTTSFQKTGTFMHSTFCVLLLSALDKSTVPSSMTKPAENRFLSAAPRVLNSTSLWAINANSSL